MSNHSFDVSVNGQGLYDITPQVGQALQASGVWDGLATVFIQHTSASLLATSPVWPCVTESPISRQFFFVVEPFFIPVGQQPCPATEHPSCSRCI